MILTRIREFLTGSTQREIAALRQTVAQLEQRLKYDAQTGVHSKLAFFDHYEAHAAEGDYLVFLDLDDFKSVNDSYGHVVGDQLLARIAQALKASIGDRGLVARLAGDEYLFHIPRRHAHEVDAIAEGLRLAVQRTEVRLGELTISRKASLGIARIRAGMGPREAVIDANRALRAAKLSGKNRAVMRHERQESLTQQPPTVEEIRLGLQRGEIGYHVQPIFAVPTMTVMGYEALLRWHRRSGEVLGPSHFLSTMTGAYDERTEPPLQAAHETAAWAILERKTAVAFNISGAFLNQAAKNGLDWVTTIVGDAPWNGIVFELVETIVDREEDAIARVVAELRERGIRIALDDFGIGRSTLQRLQRIPVDFVKIDRHFLHAAVGAERDRDILRGMIDIIRASGAATVIEGVESAEQLDLAREIGGDYVQGFHLGRPRPISAWTDDTVAEDPVPG